MEKEILYKFFAGAASDTEKEAVRRWVEADAAHRQELLAERAFYDAVMLADEKQVSPARRPARRFRNLLAQTMKWAAVILLAFVSGYMCWNYKYASSGLATNTITVPAGQRVDLSLSDGTKVCLNAGSTFTYPSFFAGDVRRVELDGEAFFEVSANKKRPFVVHTGICDVEVLGTRFNVDAYGRDASFSAALMEGRIKVKNNANPANVVHLPPRHKVTLSGGRLAVSDIRDYDVYRWKEGLICFKNQSFADLLKQVKKFYGVEFVIENKALSDCAFSGTFRISDGIENLLRVLQKDVSFRYTRSEDGNVISIK